MLAGQLIAYMDVSSYYNITLDAIISSYSSLASGMEWNKIIYFIFHARSPQMVCEFQISSEDVNELDGIISICFLSCAAAFT
jgi:hypothetical protein